MTFRQTTVTTRVRWEPGAPVELVSVDRGRGTLRLRAGEAVQTLAIVKGAEAGFDALEAGGSLLLSWRFSRDAQPEALLRVLTPDGAVSMVGAPVGT